MKRRERERERESVRLNSVGDGEEEAGNGVGGEQLEQRRTAQREKRKEEGLLY